MTKGFLAKNPSILIFLAALAAFTLPVLARRTGRKGAHAIALVFGGLGLLGIFAIRDPQLLWLPMIGVGIAWASIVSMPYAILSGAVPGRKMGAEHHVPRTGVQTVDLGRNLVPQFGQGVREHLHHFVKRVNVDVAPRLDDAEIELQSIGLMCQRNRSSNFRLCRSSADTSRIMNCTPWASAISITPPPMRRMSSSPLSCS